MSKYADRTKSKLGVIVFIGLLTAALITGVLLKIIPVMTLVKVLLGILGLSFLVVVHEFGHFIAARAVGIEVITFSIGFGPKLLSKNFILGKDKKETEFCLSLLPLGGYCRLKGEHSMLQAWEEKMTHIPHEEGALFAAAPWRRIIVSLAGPLANFLLAIILMTTLFLVRYDIKYDEPKIILASEISGGNYPADEAGMKTGDTIIAINGSEISTFDEIREHIAFAPGKEQHITVLRDGKEIELITKPRVNKEGTSGIIGISPYLEPVIATVEDPASTPLMINDRITAIDGTEIEEAHQFLTKLDPGKTYKVSLIRNGSKKEIDFTVPEDGKISFWFPEMKKKTPKMNLFTAIGAGTKESVSILNMTIKGIRLMFTKKVSVTKSLSGPIRIIYLTGDIATMMMGGEVWYGAAVLIRFIVLISVSLAFMNLLPIPALDGGQVLLFLYDWITKKELKPSLVYYYQTVGAVLVMGLVFLAFFLDIFALFGH